MTCFSLSDSSSVLVEHSMENGVTSGVLSLPLQMCNHCCMSQGKYSYDPSILSDSGPYISLCPTVWTEQKKGTYTVHSHLLGTALATSIWKNNKEYCMYLPERQTQTGSSRNRDPLCYWLNASEVSFSLSHKGKRKGQVFPQLP